MQRHSTIALRACLAAMLAGLSALALAAPAGKKTVPPDVAAQPGLRLNGGCQGEAARPATMALQMGKSTMLRLPEAVTRRSVGNPAVVQAMLVAPDTLYIAAVDVGTTNMIVQGRSGLCSVIDITVAMDPGGLQAMLGAAMPDEKQIRVLAANDTLVLTGTVSDASAVNRAVELAGAYVRRPLRP
ncbi:MAG: type II and III secretion system protein family protein, partial [Oxalobacteraceae bacterium]